VASATEPLVSLLASAEASSNGFARDLGLIADAATALLFFFFGRTYSTGLTCLFKKVIFLNLILNSLHKHPKLCLTFAHFKFSPLADLTISLKLVILHILEKQIFIKASRLHVRLSVCCRL